VTRIKVQFSSFLNAAKKSLTLQLALLYGGVFLLGMIAVGLFVGLRTGQLVDRTIDAYGETVVAQLANASIDAALQRDMISLQAHVGRLLEAQGILAASLYDMENQLLAQAGATPRELHGRDFVHHFTAALALGDNVAGRAVIALDTRDIEPLQRQIVWALLAACTGIFLLMLVISFRIARYWRQQQMALSREFLAVIPADVLLGLEKEIAAHAVLTMEDVQAVMGAVDVYVDELKQPSPAMLLNAAAEIAHPSHGYAYLLLECQNFEVLQRQVSRERLRALLNLFQLQLEGACCLYGGQRIPTAGAYVKIMFAARADQPEAAALQAASCAYVLSGVLKDCRDADLGISLHWTMALDWHGACENDLLRNTQLAADEKRAQWLCQQVGVEQLAVSEETQRWLREEKKITLSDSCGAGGKLFYRLLQFAESHQLLLDRQIEQLRQHL
jgi:hypothetical protein